MHAAVAIPRLEESLRERQEAAPVARPFLKWAGGKRRVVPRLLERLDGPIRRYHEPFVGGGAFFFELAGRRSGERGWAVLTDMNERLVRTYRGIRDSVDQVLELLAEHEDGHGEDYFYATRAQDVDASPSDAEVAAWMVYLNKTGFNGLYRVNRRGGFNVPFGRYDRPAILDEPNLRACHRVLQGVELRCGDFTAVASQAEAGDAVYFDPPYVPLTPTASFTAYTSGGFGPADQVRLRDIAEELRGRGVHVLLSNHDTEEVRELYAGWQLESIQVGRAINSAASRRGPVAELIISP